MAFGTKIKKDEGVTFSEPAVASVEDAPFVPQVEVSDDPLPKRARKTRKPKPNPLETEVVNSAADGRTRRIPVANDNQRKQVKSWARQAASANSLGLRVYDEDSVVLFVATYNKRTRKYTAADIRTYLGIPEDVKVTNEDRQAYKSAHNLK